MSKVADDILVMAEWYDQFIPPRHHMAIVTMHQARMIARSSLVIRCWYVSPEVLQHEGTEARRFNG